MITLTIDGKEVSVEPGSTILQACRKLGVEIPVFCYHDRLTVAGNCRMCLVDVEKSPKPVASCSMPVMEGMVVSTTSKQTIDARKGTLEFLLINHPLDCPICDQGGECDLQDITVNYGCGKSRYEMNKRAVTDKYMGPLVKTIMTRCIHCTRCVRFSEEIAGVEEIGILGRGEHAEITSYLEHSLKSELSGNVIDLCPVGALTSKPYAFHGRPWELKHTPTIGVHDALGSHIRLDHAHKEVMRVLPRECNEINEEWLDDRTRFGYDGLNRQRIDKPYIRINGKLKASTWGQAFEHIGKELHKKKPSEIAALSGDLADCESQLLLRNLLNGLKSNQYDCRPADVFLPTAQPSHFLFNSKIAGINDMDVLLLVGTNTRHDAALLNARIGQQVRKGKLIVGLIGPKQDLTFNYEHIGEGAADLTKLIDAKSPFSNILKNATRPGLIIGLDALKNRDAPAILEACQTLAHTYGILTPDWQGLNILHKHANTVGGMLLNFTYDDEKGTANLLDKSQKGKVTFLYLLNFDRLPKDYDKQCFIVYQGHHGDEAAQLADVILPGATYVEKNATYVNMEGRVQRTVKALDCVGDAKEDWRIVRALAEHLAIDLKVNTAEQLQSLLESEHPAFKAGHVSLSTWKDFKSKVPQRLTSKPFIIDHDTYYMNDVILKHSPTMAKCLKEISGAKVAA